MTIHSIKSECPPLARIITKATYSSDGQTHLWIGSGRLDGKALAEVKAFAESVQDVYHEGDSKYIFDLEGYEFNINCSRTHVSLVVTRSVK